MKSFLKYFLILFVAQTFAAADQDLTGKAFNLLAKSVQLQSGKKLTQNNFKGAITSLKTFLENRYPKIKTDSKELKERSHSSEEATVINIRPVKDDDEMSPEIKKALGGEIVELNDFNKEYECIINDHYCKAKLIPLCCAVGAYLHFYQTPNSDDQKIEDYIRNFPHFLATILASDQITSDKLNKVYQVQGTIAGQLVKIKGTLAGVIFRFADENDINTCLIKGGDPMIQGSYEGQNLEAPNTTVIQEYPVGGLLIYHTRAIDIIRNIKITNEIFPVKINTNEDGTSYELEIIK
jgi:hypothetical protein